MNCIAFGLSDLILQAGSGYGTPEVGNYSGAVSHLVSASLQTAGLYAQQKILVDFADLLHSGGALLYIVAIIGALASTALFGNYRQGIYLLIAPVLFFFMIEHRTTVNAVNLRIGARLEEQSEEDQKRFLHYIQYIEENTPPADVSWFFGFVDGIVSYVVQNAVEVFLDTENKQDILAQARERAFSTLLLKEIPDPQYLTLLALGTMGKCAQLNQAQMRIAELEVDRMADDEAIRQRLLREYQEAERNAVIIFDEQLVNYLHGKVPAGEIPITDPDGKALISCRQIWQFSVQIAQHFAERYVEAQRNHDPASGIPWDRATEQALQTLNGNAVQAVQTQADGDHSAELAAATQKLALFILRNTLPKATHHAMTQQVFDHVPFDSEMTHGVFRETAGAESRGGFLMIQYFAAAIPYIQGLLLYLLSMAFPFFALFLLMPGRASAFLVWIALWVWVKSWDVGFALGDVARDLLWKWVAHDVVNGVPDVVDLSDPGYYFRLVINNDPLATENSYYVMIGLLTVSIPLLTAHLCLGATNLFDAFKNSIDQGANRFGLHASLSARRELGSDWEKIWNEQREARARFDAWEEMRRENPSINGVDLKTATADYAVARRMDQLYLKHAFDQHWSKNSYHALGMLAMTTKRRMTFTNNEAARYLDAVADETAMKHLVRSKGSESDSILNPWTSDKPGVDGASVPQYAVGDKAYGADADDGDE